MTAPEDLDIHYTLDLTKLVMKPSRSGLKILSRFCQDLLQVFPNITRKRSSQ